MRCALVVALLLIAVTSVAATSTPEANPVGTYTTHDTSIESYYWDHPKLTNSTGVYDVTEIPPSATSPDGPTWFLVNRVSGFQFAVWRSGRVEASGLFGTIEWFDYPGSTGALEVTGFFMDLQPATPSNPPVRIIGRRQPPAPPASVAFNLSAGQAVSGTVGVKMSAAGLSTSTPYMWSTSVDAKQISLRRETATAITLFWNTAGVVVGTHTLSVKVTDAAGRVATGSVSVVVKR